MKNEFEKYVGRYFYIDANCHTPFIPITVQNLTKVLASMKYEISGKILDCKYHEDDKIFICIKYEKDTKYYKEIRSEFITARYFYNEMIVADTLEELSNIIKLRKELM